MSEFVVPENPFAPDPPINNDLASRYDGGPAYPVPMGTQHNQYACTVGMSLRDWFAGQALAGMNATLISEISWPDDKGPLLMARAAYRQADAMIEARGIK